MVNHIILGTQYNKVNVKYKFNSNQLSYTKAIIHFVFQRTVNLVKFKQLSSTHPVNMVEESYMKYEFHLHWGLTMGVEDAQYFRWKVILSKFNMVVT